FSTENWDRSKEEVDYLMNLLLWVAKNETKALHKENVRLRFLGSRDRLSPEIIHALDSAEEKTKNNTRATLALCLNYGGRQEITDAIKHIVNDKIPSGDVTTGTVEKYLYEPDIPAIDFAIRTSGEQRISDFMLWRIAYAELYFAKPAWPGFTPDDLKVALQDFAKRQRRFGT
ncbi:MAG TPA: polyprenyl diphosphate synthase, partial [Candidatus Limnocylindrales bacterium]|nr:polyprenyl diphosphate synthase [Candidatus Limnocylindrales bacterium]